MRDEFFMALALEEAALAAAAGEMPVGCVIVQDDAVVARGHNECETAHDPTAHAEILAIRRASATLNDWRLSKATLYVTLEPCPMCAGAIMQARIGRLVFGAADSAQGCAGSLYRIPEDPAFPHFCICEGGILTDKCENMLRSFFHRLRNRE